MIHSREAQGALNHDEQAPNGVCLPPSLGKISGEGTWALWSVSHPEPLGYQRFGGVHVAFVQEGKGNLVPLSRASFVCSRPL